MDGSTFFMSEKAELDFIQNAKTGTLHDRYAEGHHYIQVVFENREGFEIRTAPRTSIRVRYLDLKGDIAGIEIVKLVRDEPTQRLSLNTFDLQQLRGFLSF